MVAERSALLLPSKLRKEKQVLSMSTAIRRKSSTFWAQMQRTRDTAYQTWSPGRGRSWPPPGSQPLRCQRKQQYEHTLGCRDILFAQGLVHNLQRGQAEGLQVSGGANVANPRLAAARFRRHQHIAAAENERDGFGLDVRGQPACGQCRNAPRTNPQPSSSTAFTSSGISPNSKIRCEYIDEHMSRAMIWA